MGKKRKSATHDTVATTAPASVGAASEADAKHHAQQHRHQQEQQQQRRRNREDGKPPRFTHPSLAADRPRKWLSPGDALFDEAVKTSYRGFRIEPAATLGKEVHSAYRDAFGALHAGGLFLYDVVQAGGKRLSSTFVTRTLVGEAGITYKYLGLRIFAHPWRSSGGPGCSFACGPSSWADDAKPAPESANARKKKKHKAYAQGAAGDSAAPGAASAAAEHAAVTGLWGESALQSLDPKVEAALQQIGALNEWFQQRAERACAAQGITARLAAQGHTPGSFNFNLTLINRMEPSGHGEGYHSKLKPEPLFGMGKASVSWHADSCLLDYSTIGVYHVTHPPAAAKHRGSSCASTACTATTDWKVAVRCSAEQGGGGGSGTTDAVGAGAGGSKGNTAGQGETPEVLTPPLVVPLRSGDAYLMLDDFNHFHEHLVLAGEHTLRYSSTHRVSVRDGNTWDYIAGRCKEVLSMPATAAASGKTSHTAQHHQQQQQQQHLDLSQLRAEQALLTELEGEWLFQFWAQGRTHARRHPWWRRPMNALVGWWSQLEARTAAAVSQLLLPNHQGTDTVRALKTLVHCLEARQQQRARWSDRLADSAYRSLPRECTPQQPALWQGSSTAVLPFDLAGTIVQLRARYADAYGAASGGKAVAASAKALAAGATSNWAALQKAKFGGSTVTAAAAPRGGAAPAPRSGKPAKHSAKGKGEPPAGSGSRGKRGGGQHGRSHRPQGKA